MHTLPASSHTEQALARFHAMQRQLHALAARWTAPKVGSPPYPPRGSRKLGAALRFLERALYQPDPLARLQRQHAQDLELLQREFGDCGSRASHRRSDLRR
ncbi:MAG: hypothetical protein RBR52_09090 [Thiomonas sp.]|uniref:hypothetical protein n=1 Tax=Thiomonas sp. TaxID=2047785 RepID=UPI002A358EBD|nr:hypothetical protein [Thiomonas sp.]MDY0330634.1 hypothetical protein [Thiomonas sp.]